MVETDADVPAAAIIESDLEAVGVTAAISAVLTEVGTRATSWPAHATTTCSCRGIVEMTLSRPWPPILSTILDIHSASLYRDGMELSDLGATIRSTRLASGLSQAQLARMAGISRATLNYTEQGHSALGADALLRILASLGLRISPATSPDDRRTVSAIDLLAASASVSFKESIPGSEVEAALVTGVVEARWLPHIAVIIDEASDVTLLRALRETSEKTSVTPATIWRNLRSIARKISSPHPRWA